MTNSFTLEQAQALENSYQPNQTIKEALKDTSLVMFVGPVATGKTFVMKNIIRENSAFGCVSSFTTREARADDDPSMFRYIPHEETSIAQYLKKIQQGEVVQYAVHPTSHRLYGSEAEDYSKKYNMLATLSGIVSSMTQLPFKQSFLICLVCQPSTWDAWLLKRFPVPNKDKHQRIEEAIQSLTWLLTNSSPVIWVENVPNQPEKTARDVIDAILYNKRSDQAKTLAYAMLKRAKELL